mmetsp:Transcript_22374/g.34193  ORF Transcript_22374/g.34193 Transcript_22374/m.34193 type:complete len:354 (-) Transcript_22374:11-1072(-)
MPSAFSYDPVAYMQSFLELVEDLKKEDEENEAEGEEGEETTPAAIYKKNGARDFSKMVVAVVQLETKANMKAADFWKVAVDTIEQAVKQQKANLVVLQELFLGPYFCQSQDPRLFSLALEADPATNPFLKRLVKMAKELQVVLPISFFERKNNAFYNSMVMIDADGTILGKYRKSHIPDGTGYQEKFYFSPGDTGFKVFHTKVGTIGVGICWDQWFPEAARAMTLQGADILLYPTAIGSEPTDSSYDSSDHWQRVMQGHAAANMVPVVAANRFGTEVLREGNKERQRILFYGRSFISDETGAIVQEAQDGSDMLVAEIHPSEVREARAYWGLFRDRRPELYGGLRTRDGEVSM